MQFEEVQKIVGEDNVCVKDVCLEVYSYDASEIKAAPYAVVFPKNAFDLQKLVRYCALNQIGLVARGAGTNLVGGVISDKTILVDFSKFNEILEVGCGDKFAVCETGCVLYGLNQNLKKKNLLFPVVPSSHKVCTIGGMVACNAVGNLAIKFGRMSDNVLEVSYIDSEGRGITVFDKKSIDELCGSEGCFGLIYSVKLKLVDLFESISFDHFEFEDVKDMIRFVNGLRGHFNIDAIEFISPITASLNLLSKKYHLFIEYSDNTGVIRDKEQIKELWEKRETVAPKLYGAGYKKSSDPKIPDGRLVEFLEWISKREIPCFGHIGVGVIHPRFRKDQVELMDEMYDFVKSIGGEVSGEHGIGLVKQKYLSEEFKNKFLGLKQKYDPVGIFNPGKILGSGSWVMSPESSSGASESCVLSDEVCRELEKCSKCGMCKSNCPVFDVMLDEMNSPRGKVLLAKGGLFEEVVLNCTLCKRCTLDCPCGIDLGKVFRGIRKKLLEEGLVSEGNRMMKENIEKHGNPFGEKKEIKKDDDVYCC